MNDDQDGKAEEPDESSFDASRHLDALADLLKNYRPPDSAAIIEALKNYGPPDSAAIIEAFKNYSPPDSAAIIEALKNYRPPAQEPASRLFPESAPEDADLTPEPPVQSEPTDETFSELAQHLKTQGFEPVIQADSMTTARLTFELRAGRSSRPVTVRADDVAVLLATEVGQWRSMQRYDGIWSEAQKIIEVAIRGDKLGLSSVARLLERLTGGPLPRGSMQLPTYHVSGDHGVELYMGSASDLARVLLFASRFSRAGLAPTLRITGLAVSTSDEADAIAERVGDSLAFDFHVIFGTSFALQRLEARNVVKRPARWRRFDSPSFPRSGYPHAAVVLFQAGRDRSTAPLIRYWAFYQVLEYFFPKFVWREALGAASRLLRSPAFDPHREDQVAKVLEIALSRGGSTGSEADQLLSTIRAVVTSSEIAALIEEFGLGDQVTRANPELTSRTLSLRSPDSLLSDLAQRIYDIRCRIVHSKSASTRQDGPGLLPGTHHDDLIQAELPVIEFLAEQAIISAAEPLRF